MIHYIYTTFHEATLLGTPLMRTMFMEFPDDVAFYEADYQYMLGSSMLIVPKLKKPNVQLQRNEMQEVSYMLPSNYTWYDYYSKQTEEGTSMRGPIAGMKTRAVTDLEQAVYIKGGSVLPILEHEGCMALSKCINNGIRLEVYLDSNSIADGQLYTDDGVSFKHLTDDQFAQVSFSWQGTNFYSQRDSVTKYAFPDTQTITQVVVFGLSEEPDSVMQNGKDVPSFTVSKDGGLVIDMPANVAPDQI